MPKTKQKPKLEHPELGKEEEFMIKWWEKLKKVLKDEGIISN